MLVENLNTMEVSSRRAAVISAEYFYKQVTNRNSCYVLLGSVPEWLKGAVLKTVGGLNRPGVRIPPLPLIIE